MGKYGESIQLMFLALLALLISFIWDDLSFIAIIAFLTFIILAAQRAFAGSQTFGAKVKLLSFFSAVLVLLFILGFTVMNPPQCTYETTQAEIDASGCIIGANIGLGLYFMFVVIPFALVVLALWVIALFPRIKGHKKT